MRIKPVKGTNDYLPEQAALRDYLQKTICDVYEHSGFARITTPVVEDIENLDKSEGGDNLNLIFKVMKRGEKLAKALEAGDPDGIADMGLRYDLTLPLSRYYAHNRASLPQPFKVIQIDRVYRAERPGKGRLREFMQCDIDILGSESPSCEIELIHTTAKALMAVGIDRFKIKINDRRILREVLRNVGYKEEDLDSVCISFDKLDKIGTEGVMTELADKGFAPEVNSRFRELMEKAPFTLSYVRSLLGESQAADTLEKIIRTCNSLSGGDYEVVYDMTLVRGQGYYTGAVFEVESLDFKSSIAGGGRYDNLIGKFVKDSVPAVGFSIGFERIFSILWEKGSRIPRRHPLIALFHEEDQVEEALKKADELRAGHRVGLYVTPKKLGKFLNKLEQQGFDGFMVLGRDEEIRMFGE
ncbi:MAG: histidine--tRNA ligase [Eubacterium sp.]|nr:histidine--tRNA ligase [Eubacterium sp.]